MAAPDFSARSVVFVNKTGTDDPGYNPVGKPAPHLTIVSALADLAANYNPASSSNPHVVAVGPGVFVSAAIALPPWTYICGSCDGQGEPNTEIQLTGNITAGSGWNANSTARGGIANLTIRASSGTPVIDFTMPAPVSGNPSRTIQLCNVRHNLTQELFEATSTADVWERTDTIQDGVNTDVITQTGGTSRLIGYNLCAAIITIQDKTSFATSGQWQGVVNTAVGSGLVARSVAAAGCTLRLTLSTLRELTLAETAPGVIAVAADAPSIPLVGQITFSGTAVDADLTRLTDSNALAGGGGSGSQWFDVTGTPGGIRRANAGTPANIASLTFTDSGSDVNVTLTGAGGGGTMTVTAAGNGQLTLTGGGFSLNIDFIGRVFPNGDGTLDLGIINRRFKDLYLSGLLTKPGGAVPLITTSTAVTNGAGASAGTLTNAPAVGNPTKWMPIDDNGTVRYFPTW